MNLQSRNEFIKKAESARRRKLELERTEFKERVDT